MNYYTASKNRISQEGFYNKKKSCNVALKMDSIFYMHYYLKVEYTTQK